MAFTAAELSNIANATLDWFYTPDHLTPLERARDRVAKAKQALREAEKDLELALEYRKIVHALPKAERHRRWDKREDWQPIDTMMQR